MGGRGVLGLTPGGGWVFVFVFARCASRGCADAAGGARVVMR